MSADARRTKGRRSIQEIAALKAQMAAARASVDVENRVANLERRPNRGWTVNPGDIEIDPAILPLIDLGAGSASFSVTDTSLGIIYDDFFVIGRFANFHAGFGLQVGGAWSNIIYASNVRIGLAVDDNSAGSSLVSAGTASWSLPGVGAYNGVYTTAWKTIAEPTLGGTATDYVFIAGGGEPYYDTFASTFTGTMYWRWVYMPDGLLNEGIELPTPTDPTVPNVVTWDPDTGGWATSSSTKAVARVGARVNSGGTTYERQRINLVEGSGVDLSVADDAVNEEVDVTVTVDGSELSITGFSFPGGDTFLRADGTFADYKDRLVAVFSGTPTAGGSYPVIIPRGNDDADISIDLERLALRLESPASSGTTTAILQKSVGGGAPAWSDIATISISSGNYEGTEQTIGSYTITSGDLLRLYFTAVGTGADWYTGTVTGTEV